MRLNEMIKNRADMLGTMRQFLDSHEDNNGNLSADDAATYAKMEAEFDAITDSIKREQRAADREAELSKPVNTPITGKPYTGDRECLQLFAQTSDRFLMFCRKA